MELLQNLLSRTQQVLMNREQLFPPIDPYESGRLPVDGEHLIYWEQSGNSGGIPVVFLHGGPGAGATPVHRRFFDPTAYRIIIFDKFQIVNFGKLK